MAEWVRKRFWTSAAVVSVEGGFAVELDGRSVRTPAKSALILPTRALADAVAAEWAGAPEVIDPARMPLTRAANSAVDKVAVQREEVAEMLAAYGDADLLCYRATEPEELMLRQAVHWDPLLDWAADRYAARLVPVAGVIHAAQAPEALKNLAAPISEMSDFQLTGFHDLVTISGSLIIGLAATASDADILTLWQAAQVDEIWQSEKWGQDDDASAVRAAHRQAFTDARIFYELSTA